MFFVKSGAEGWVLVPGESSVRVLGGSMQWWLYTSVRSPRSLRAATSIHHHPWDLAMDNLLLVIEVEHVNGGHLGRGTAGPCRAAGVGVLHQVGVWVFLHEHVLALAGAVVGFVAFGGNDPVPAERLEIHSQRVATAARLGGVLVTVQAKVSARTLGRLENLYFQERLLESGGEGAGRKERGGYKRTAPETWFTHQLRNKQLVTTNQWCVSRILCIEVR